LKNQQFVIVD